MMIYPKCSLHMWKLEERRKKSTKYELQVWRSWYRSLNCEGPRSTLDGETMDLHIKIHVETPTLITLTPLHVFCIFLYIIFSLLTAFANIWYLLQALITRQDLQWWWWRRQLTNHLIYCQKITKVPVSPVMYYLSILVRLSHDKPLLSPSS